jgi:hypothetical protein
LKEEAKEFINEWEPFWNKNNGVELFSEEFNVDCDYPKV